MTDVSHSKPPVEFSEPALRQLDIVLPGSKDLHDALLALAWTTVDRGWLSRVLLWGWVGTGKTVFPLSLHQALVFARLRFALLTIDCSRFACMSQEAAKVWFDFIERVVRDSTPLLIAVNETEFLHHSSGNALTALFHLLRALLSSDRDEAGTLVLVSTSRPEILDRKLQVDYQAYLPMPDKVSTAQLLLHYSGGILRESAIAMEISEELFRIAEGLNATFTARSIVMAARALPSRSPERHQTPRETAHWIAASCNLFPRADVQQFEKRNEKILLESADFVRNWKDRYRDLFDQDGRCRNLPEGPRARRFTAEVG